MAEVLDGSVDVSSATAHSSADEADEAGGLRPMRYVGAGSLDREENGHVALRAMRTRDQEGNQ